MEFLEELAAPEQVAAGVLGAVVGLWLLARFFIRRWMDRMEVEVREKAAAKSLERLAAEVARLREEFHRLEATVAGTIGNVGALDDSVARFSAELEQVRAHGAAEVRRVQDGLEELQREVWGRRGA